MRKTCDVDSSHGLAGWNGFGRYLCWGCYSAWVLSFRASDSLRVSERHPQMALDFDGQQDSDGV